MNVIIKELKSDKIILWGYIISCIFLVSNILLTAISYRHLPPVIPLYNQMPWGATRLGERPTIFIPTVLAVVSFISNVVILSILYQKIPLVSRILSITTLLMCILAFLLVIRTIQLVI